MNIELLNKINEEVQAGRYGVLCTVTGESGSTPRSRGASMWVRPDGSIAGTIGGGLIEYEAIQEALRLMNSGEPSRTWHKNLTERDGMACGGSADVYMETIGRCDELVIFGGGQSGCEAALELVLQGKHPTIVEYAVDLVAAANVPLPNASYLREALVFHKVPIYLESTITNIKDGSVTVKGKDGTITEVECDNVVNAIGFLPTPVAKKGKNVHLVGDCIAIGNLRTVIWRAWDVCMKI